MELNEDQTNAMEIVKSGKNITILGNGGVGKSYLIGKIKEYFSTNNIEYGITATTGTAAILIGGRTLHSFMGIGIGKGSPEDLIKRIYRIDGLFGQLLDLKALIIDEASMMSDVLFDTVARIFSLIHKMPEKPFGNVQIILVGDFCQLKPVEGDYCFKANLWDLCDFNICMLKKNMRIKNDETFRLVVDRLRWGKCNQSDFEYLEKLKNTQFDSNSDIIPTRLFPKNKNVDQINTIELDKLVKLGNETKVYPVKYTSGNSLKMKASSTYVSSQKIPESVKLTLGSQVMVTRNIDPCMGIVNGTRGVVTSFGLDFVMIKLVSGQEYPVTYFHVKPEMFERFPDKLIDFKYMPLSLSWAMSIHKSQGTTLDCMEVDLGSDIFSHGQAYVGLSRATSSSAVRIVKLDKRSFSANKEVLEFYKKIN